MVKQAQVEEGWKLCHLTNSWQWSKYEFGGGGSKHLTDDDLKEISAPQETPFCSKQKEENKMTRKAECFKKCEKYGLFKALTLSPAFKPVSTTQALKSLDMADLF
jgi:hypothetical protein